MHFAHGRSMDFLSSTPTSFLIIGTTRNGPLPSDRHINVDECSSEVNFNRFINGSSQLLAINPPNSDESTAHTFCGMHGSDAHKALDAHRRKAACINGIAAISGVQRGRPQGFYVEHLFRHIAQ